MQFMVITSISIVRQTSCQLPCTPLSAHPICAYPSDSVPQNTTNPPCTMISTDKTSAHRATIHVQRNILILPFLLFVFFLVLGRSTSSVKHSLGARGQEEGLGLRGLLLSWGLLPDLPTRGGLVGSECQNWFLSRPINEGLERIFAFDPSYVTCDTPYCNNFILTKNVYLHVRSTSLHKSYGS
ncbi:unnamed protein product [Choristocarpus tenellus]